jgi:acyl-CoA thioester hydrolase
MAARVFMVAMLGRVGLIRNGMRMMADSGGAGTDNERPFRQVVTTSMSERAPAPSRSDFRLFRPMPTRWMDNDVYGHVNNVVYYSYFDTAVNGYLIDATGTDIRALPAIGVVAETSCRYFESVTYPDALEVGLAVERLGRSSIVYQLGIFVQGKASIAAAGRFVHVYVDSAQRGTVPVPEPIRAAVLPLVRATPG